MYSSNPCVQHIVPRIITEGFPKCKCVIRIKASDIAYNDSAFQSHAGLLVQPNLDPLFLHYVLMITNLLAHNRLVIRSCVRKKKKKKEEYLCRKFWFMASSTNWHFAKTGKSSWSAVSWPSWPWLRSLPSWKGLIRVGHAKTLKKNRNNRGKIISIMKSNKCTCASKYPAVVTVEEKAKEAKKLVKQTKTFFF